MSTTFFWDNERKKFLFEKRRVGLEQGDFDKVMTYVFRTTDDFKKFLESKNSAIIYDNDGTLWTVDSLRKEIIKKGCVVFIEDYYLEKGDKQ